MNSVDEDVIEVPLNVDLTVAPPYTLGSVSILFAGIPESSNYQRVVMMEW